jgi:biopolymer transport protein ExbB
LLEPNQPKSVYTSMEHEPLFNFAWLAFDGWIGKAVLILLAVNTAGAVGITIDRIFRYRTTHKASADFRRQVGRLRAHNLDDLISISQKSDSPRAVVIAAALNSFQRTGCLNSDTSTFETAKHASKQSARAVHFQLSRGLNSLAAIIATVLFVGAFGTCYNVLTAFKGCGCSIESLRAALAYEYSRALIPTAWGFFVGVPSMWAHRYLDSEMNSSILKWKPSPSSY